MQQLEVLAKIRLALGRKLYQVDQWLILGNKSPALTQEQQSLLREIDFKVREFSSTEINDNEALFSKAKIFSGSQ